MHKRTRHLVRLVAARRLLLEEDKLAQPDGRAFDILAALVECAGEVVAKETLMARVWPQTFMEEANLKIQVSALRRALGGGQNGRRHILTVPGRGYNFVAPVRFKEPSPPGRKPEIVPPKVNNPPLTVIRVIGRDDVVAAVVARLSRRRLVTIAGPGGIGKTTVALAVAKRMPAICSRRTTRRPRSTFDGQSSTHSGKARQELASLYDRFTGGFDTADLISAKQPPDELNGSRHR